MNLEDKLIYTSPTGYLNMVITMGIYIGVVLAAPIVLYQVWLFIAPGLYKNERAVSRRLSFPRFSCFLPESHSAIT